MSVKYIFEDASVYDGDIYMETRPGAYGSSTRFRFFMGDWVAKAMGIETGSRIGFDFSPPGHISLIYSEDFIPPRVNNPVELWTLQWYTGGVYFLDRVAWHWVPRMPPGSTFPVSYTLPGICGFMLPSNVENIRTRCTKSDPDYLKLPPFREAKRKPFQVAQNVPWH